MKTNEQNTKRSKIIMPHCPKCEAFQVIQIQDDYECLVCGNVWNIIQTKHEAGDKCDVCDGRIALMSTVITEAEMDGEPYSAGCYEGNGGWYPLEDSICVSIHACDSCGKVFSKEFEN